MELWNSRELPKHPLFQVSNPEEVILKILTDISQPDTPLHRQVKRHFHSLGGVGSKAFWQAYVQCWDAWMPFTKEFQAMLEKLESEMPGNNARIYDIGSLAFNIGTHWLLTNPSRSILSTGLTPIGLEIAESKRSILNLETKQAHLQGGAIMPQTNELADAIFVQPILQRMRHPRPLIKGLSALLKPNAKLYILTYQPRLSRLENAKSWFWKLSRSAVEKHAPLTATQLAFLWGAFWELYGKTPRKKPIYTLTSERQIKELAAWAEMKCVAQSQTLGSMGTLYTLEKK